MQPSFPKSALPAAASGLTPAQKRGLRSRCLRAFVREKVNAGEVAVSQIIPSSNRWPNIPDALARKKQALIVMLEPGIDDSDRPVKVQIWVVKAKKLLEMREAVRRARVGRRQQVAIPFDKATGERSAGNIQTAAGSIDKYAKLVVEQTISWE